MNTMEKLYRCMRDQTPELTLAPELMAAARLPLERMLVMSTQIASSAINQS